MLVVVKDRNISVRLQRLLDVEAFRRLDIFQVDAAKVGSSRAYGVDKSLRVFGQRARTPRPAGILEPAPRLSRRPGPRSVARADHAGTREPRQGSIVPFSLTLAHPGGATASDVSVDRLRIRIEQDAGLPVVPSSLVDQVVVNEGTNVYVTKSALEASGATVDLPFSTPATVTGTQPATLSLRLDVSAATTVPAFRVVIEDGRPCRPPTPPAGRPSRRRCAAARSPSAPT